jgi:hypothetical protein
VFAADAEVKWDDEPLRQQWRAVVRSGKVRDTTSRERVPADRGTKRSLDDSIAFLALVIGGGIIRDILFTWRVWPLSLRFINDQLSVFPLHFPLAMALRTSFSRACLRTNSCSPATSVLSQWKRGNATVAPPVTQDATGSKGPTAMVFMNMGGPSTTDEVGNFLSRLFVCRHRLLSSLSSNPYRRMRT